MVGKASTLRQRLPAKGGWRLWTYFLAAQGFFAAHGFAFFAAQGFIFFAAHGFFFLAAQGLADLGAQGFFFAAHGFAKAGPPRPSARVLASANFRGCLSIFILESPKRPKRTEMCLSRERCAALLSE